MLSFFSKTEEGVGATARKKLSRGHGVVLYGHQPLLELHREELAYRMVGVGKNLWRSSPTLLPRQAHLKKVSRDEGSKKNHLAVLQ